MRSASPLTLMRGWIMAGEIATAYVTVMPRMSKSFADDIGAEVDGAVDNATRSTSRLGSIGGVVAGAMAGAFAATAGAVISVGRSALDAYADFEQLSGGIETLFGDDAQTVMDNASQAFKTAGMDANQYMEMATSSAAAMISSLGGDTAEAARLTDQAMTDMADNANKMGTSLESIQTAYAGFAKGNFTMLDNLALGYGGTQAEMERLLADAEAISGVHYDISSYADITEAIHVVQTEMGITGTTAAEAASTISGSVAMTKSAWQNLVAGLGNENADLAALVSDVVDSAMAALGNIAPRIGQIANGIAAALPQLVGSLVPMIPQIVTPILDAAIQALTGLIQYLPEIVGAAMELLNGVVQSLIDAVPVLIPVVIQAITGICGALLENLPMLIGAAMTLFLGVADGLLQALPEIIGYIPVLVQTLCDNMDSMIPMMIEVGVALFTAIIANLPAILEALYAAVVSIGESLFGWFTGLVPTMIEAGGNLLQGLIDGLVANAGRLLDTIVAICSDALDGFLGFFDIHSPSRVMRGVGGYIGEGLALGISGSDGMVSKAVDSLSASAMLDMQRMTASMSVQASYAGSSVYAPEDAVASRLSRMNVYIDGKTLVGAVCADMGAAQGRMARLGGIA